MRAIVRTRLHTYAATLAAFAVAPITLQAAIVYSGLVNINIPSTVDGVYLNVVTGATSFSSTATPFGWDVNLWGANSLDMFTPTPSPGGGAYYGSGSNYALLPLGFVVGPSSTFCSAVNATVSPSTPLQFNSATNLIGFRFRNEANGNQIHYGWMRIALASTAAAQPRTLVEYAYQNVAGQPITFPPSPGTVGVGLLALALGIRRRRA